MEGKIVCLALGVAGVMCRKKKNFFQNFKLQSFKTIKPIFCDGIFVDLVTAR